jgi:hypothetical protein
VLGPLHVENHPNDPISEQNSSGTLLLFFLSKWILKSPTIVVFVVEEASRSRSEENSSKNSEILLVEVDR